MIKAGKILRSTATRRYGVLEQNTAANDIDCAVESIRHLGYAVIDGGYETQWISKISEAFDNVYTQSVNAHGGIDKLSEIDERHSIRMPLYYNSLFLDLAMNAKILEVCRQLIANYIVLNQQNGVINPPLGERYNQGEWHRDLPYQHFVSSRPIAINALFCIDSFSIDNGATMVLPASHRQEAFPSDHFVRNEGISIEAPSGSFIMLDCMAFHSGGINSTTRPRRGVNHVYTIPYIRQQIDMPSSLGDDFEADAEVRRLLGYDVRTPQTIEEYFSGRRLK